MREGVGGPRSTTGPLRRVVGKDERKENVRRWGRMGRHLPCMRSVKGVGVRRGTKGAEEGVKRVGTVGGHERQRTKRGARRNGREEAATAQCERALERSSWRRRERAAHRGQRRSSRARQGGRVMADAPLRSAPAAGRPACAGFRSAGPCRRSSPRGSRRATFCARGTPGPRLCSWRRRAGEGGVS